MPASAARRLLSGVWSLGGTGAEDAAGPAVAPSRVLFGPHETNLGRGRRLSPAHAEYYAERAAGGTGVLVVETASVTEDDHPYERAPLAAECEAGWARIAGACRPHGTVVLAGLGHTGGQGSTTWTRRPLSAPSPVPDVASRLLPSALGPDGIDAVVEGFAAAAGRARLAGLAGVEVDAGARSLLRQFGSALTNHRDDVFGSDRWLLLVRVLEAVRGAVGPEGVLGLRLSADEQASWGGIGVGEAAAVAVRTAPLLDLLVVVRGGPYRPEACRPDGHTPPADAVPLAGAVRSALRRAGSAVPVVLQGGLVDLAQAQQALDDEVCDAVEMTRAQIADPHLVAHVRAGRPERVRPCVRCNQACLVRDVRNPLVGCIAEPRGVPVPLPRARASRGEVLVVGGGPAGLEAARVLAEAGRVVRLCEQEDQLGGMLLRIARLPGRAAFDELRRWWVRELDRLGVRVETGLTADVTVDGLGADTTADGTADVVLALGSTPGPRDHRLDAGAVVVEAADLLDPGRTPMHLPSGAVLVSDPQGASLGVGVAELLASGGRTVVLSSPDAVVGARLAVAGDLADANTRLARAGVRCRPGTRLFSVGAGTARLVDVWTGSVDDVAVAVVVHCGPRAPAPVPDGWPGRRVGDCVAPRTVAEAVREGRAAALTMLTERRARPHAQLATA